MGKKIKSLGLSGLVLIVLLSLTGPGGAADSPGSRNLDVIKGGPWGLWGGPDTMEWVIGDGSRTSCAERMEYGLTYCAQTYACGFSKGQNLQPPTVTGLTPSRVEIPVGGKAEFSATASDADGTVESVLVRVAGGSDQTTPGESKKSVKVSYSQEFSKPGRYYATVTATDNDGLKGSATVEIVVGTDAERAGAPSIAALSMSPESGDPPLKIGVSIVGFSLDTITGWTISWGDGGSDFSQTGGVNVETDHTFDKPGTYTVVITVEDNKGRVHSETRTITVNSTNSQQPETQSAGLPGLVLEWTHPGGEVQRWFLPLDSSGQTDEGITWSTALGSAYSVSTVKFDWTIPESIQASLAPGDHKWTTWLVDSEGKKSNRRYFYYTVGDAATRSPVQPSEGELTFNLLASLYGNESLTPQNGTVEVYVNGALAETKEIDFGQVSLTVTPGLDAQWVFRIIDNDPRTVHLIWEGSVLKIYYGDATTPVNYYQAEDGSYYLEYWAPNLYICGVHTDYAPIMGRWWVRRD